MQILSFNINLNDMSYTVISQMSDKALLEMLGQFIQKNRLNQNKTQDQVSKAAGISRSTLSLLERGENVRIDSLIQVLRVLDLLYVLEAFKVTEQISPLQYAKLQKKQRKQASPNKVDDNDISDLGW